MSIWCLMLLSTIFKLYLFFQIYCLRKRLACLHVTPLQIVNWRIDNKIKIKRTKMTNICPQHTTQKTEDWSTWTPLRTIGWTLWLWKCSQYLLHYLYNGIIFFSLSKLLLKHKYLMQIVFFKKKSRVCDLKTKPKNLSVLDVTNSCKNKQFHRFFC